ncbi:MAG: hypothetical protein AAFZ99_04050 [Pseudomonadota bacterium]
MPGTQKSFAERIAQIEKDKAPAPAPEQVDVSRPRHMLARAPDMAGRAVSRTVNILSVVVLIPTVLGFVLLFGGDGVRTMFASAAVPGFGTVNASEDTAEDRYEWDTKPTPLNAARLGMKRMNAFAQDMSDMEMNELVREARGLGQPFLANEIEREMGACETLRCRNELQNQYEAQLKKLRKSTPTW